jgi:hypothetical protein
LFVVIGLVALVLHLVFHPHPSEFRVESLTLSNFSLASTSSLTGNCDVRFAVPNPSIKMSISYYSIEPTLFYKSVNIQHTTSVVPAVDVELNGSRSVVLGGRYLYVYRWVVDAINGDMACDTNEALPLAKRYGSWTKPGFCSHLQELLVFYGREYRLYIIFFFLINH